VYAKHPTTAAAAAAVLPSAGWLDGGPKARPGAQGVRQTSDGCRCCCCRRPTICRVAEQHLVSMAWAVRCTISRTSDCCCCCCCYCLTVCRVAGRKT
jgi:hypothetical protein